ncbi:MAG TPA: DNA mismatch repair protein MutT [Holosporales bacterium]|nr:DNA mismatch repair protein MutT [Holosporales bacterium]
MTTKDKIHVLSRAVILDQEHILLCKTLDLPKAFYFLPGGHIEHGESAKETVLRELHEEAGAQDCTIKRLLGCLEYTFEPGHSSICHNHEYNFIFEVDSPSLKKEFPIPRLEDHIELLWFPLKTLSAIDFRSEPLQNLLPKWLDNPSIQNLESVMI